MDFENLKEGFYGALWMWSGFIVILILFAGYWIVQIGYFLIEIGLDKLSKYWKGLGNNDHENFGI